MNIKFRMKSIFIISFIGVLILVSKTYSRDFAPNDLQQQSADTDNCTADGRIFDIAFSPDDKFLLTSNWRSSPNNDWESRLWNVETGEVVRDFKVYATSVSYSIDGKYVATGDSTAARLWNVNNGALVHTLPRKIEDPDGTTLKFTNDGKYLMTGGRDGATLWNIKTGEQLHSFLGQQETTLGQFADISLDGKYIVTFDALKSETYLWDAQSGNLRFTFDQTWMAMISPNDLYIVTNGQNGMAVWNIETLVIVQTLYTELDRRYGWKFSNDGRYLLEPSGELWDIQKGELIGNFPITNLGSISGILPNGINVLIPEGNHLSSEVGVWNIMSGKKVSEFQLEESSVYSLAFTQDSHYVAIATDYGHIQLWDIQEGKKVRSFC